MNYNINMDSTIAGPMNARSLLTTGQEGRIFRLKTKKHP